MSRKLLLIPAAFFSLCLMAPAVVQFAPGITSIFNVEETGKVRVIFKATRGDSAPACIDSAPVQDWLSSHCVIDAAGTPDWRRWPENITFDGSDEPKALQDLYNTTGADPSCVIIARGLRHWIIPLPTGKDADVQLLKILRKYGGE